MTSANLNMKMMVMHILTVNSLLVVTDEDNSTIAIK